MSAPKSTAVERLARLLKQRSRFPQVAAFKAHALDVARLGGADGLDCWIEARRDLGLLNDRHLSRAADELQSAALKALDEAEPPLPRQKRRRNWEDQKALLNERETQRRRNTPPVGYRFKPKHPPVPPAEERRRSMLERMAAAWERLVDKGQAA